MGFELWLEEEEAEETIDSRKLKPEDQYKLGNAAIVENGFLVGYHVTDNAEKPINTIKSNKKLTATYGKGRSKYAELGPGLYVSGIPNFWKNRSVAKWNFLNFISDQQRKKLAQRLRNDPALVGQKYGDEIFKYVSDHERDSAERSIDLWLLSGNNEVIVQLAGQPYNIPFWKSEYLEPLGIEPAPSNPVMKVEFTGKFINLKNHVFDFAYIARCIRKGLDGGFNPGGISSNAELCIWRKECITSYGME